MVKGYLALKSIGNVIPQFTKKVGRFNVPRMSASYNQVSGYTPKKGNFEIFSFFDNDGNLLKRVSEYIDKKGYSTQVERTYQTCEKERVVRESVKRDGKETSFVTTRFQAFNASKKTNTPAYHRVTREELGPVDTHRISFLTPGEKARYIEYRYDWENPIDMYSMSGAKNNDPIQNIDYLPILVSRENPRRLKQLLNMIQRLQAKLLRLPEEVVEPIERVSFAKLNPHLEVKTGNEFAEFVGQQYEAITRIVKDSKYEQLKKNILASHPEITSEKELLRYLTSKRQEMMPTPVGGEYKKYTDQIKVLNETVDSRDLLETLAHEMDHMKVCFDILRCEGNPVLAKLSSPEELKFADIAKRYPVIKKTDSRYPELKKAYKDTINYNKKARTVEGHDSLFLEQRAEAHAKAETDKLRDAAFSLRDIFV